MTKSIETPSLRAGDEPSPQATPDYEVGYGRPPKHTQFPHNKGSGGRKKGARSTKNVIREMLKMPVAMTNPDGQTRTVSTTDAAYLKLRQKALNGEQAALDRLIALAREEEAEQNSLTTKELLAEDALILRDAVARYNAAHPAADCEPDADPVLDATDGLGEER